LIDYLNGDAIEKPMTVAVAPDATDAAVGTVTTNIAHGELFLHLKGHTTQIRLRWEPGGDAARALPAGTYVATGYRHVATADDGAQWIWSTASAGFREIAVKAGAVTHVDVRQQLLARGRAFQKKGTYRVGLVFQAEKKLGNTLYRDGARIDITWQCLDGEGATLTEGPMKYG
jgi:hypothetical protein